MTITAPPSSSSSSRMLKALAVAALTSCPCSVVVDAQAVTNIIWREEFNDNGLDTSVWSYDTGNGQGGWGNGELQDYQQTNVGVDNGSLKIIASKQENMETGVPTFTSGRIKTEGKVAVKYGTIAARIKVPDVDAGLWPAFWTMGENFNQVGWPAAGEMDIMEVGQGTAIDEGVVNRRVVSAAHWQHEGTYATYADMVDTTYDLNNTWVVYYMDWTPLSVKTYVGSNQVWEMNIDLASCTDCQELHQPHFLILSMAVGGGFTGSGNMNSAGGGCGSSSSSSGGCIGRTPEEITAPLAADMQVDWVRVYDNGYTEYFGPTPAPAMEQVTTQAPVPAPTAPVPLPTLPTAQLPELPAPTVPTVPTASFPSPTIDSADASASSGKSGGKSGKAGRSGSSFDSQSFDASASGGKAKKKGKKHKKHSHSHSDSADFATSSSVLQNYESNAQRLQPPTLSSQSSSFLVAGVVALASLLYCIV